MNLSVKYHKSRSPKSKSPKRKSPKRRSPKRKSPKRKSPKRTSPKRGSLKRRSPKRRSPKRRSPKRKSPKRKSPKRTSPKRTSPKRGSPKRKYMYIIKKLKSRSVHRKSHNMLRGGRPKVDITQEGSCFRCKEPLGPNEGKMDKSIRVCNVDKLCVLNKAKKRKEEIEKFRIEANLRRLQRRIARENKLEGVNFEQIKVTTEALEAEQLQYILDQEITRQASAKYPDYDDDEFFFTIPEPTSFSESICVLLERFRRRAFKQAELERSKANMKTIKDLYLSEEKIVVVYSSDSINKISPKHDVPNQDSIEIHCTTIRPYKFENKNPHHNFYGHVTIVIRRNDTKVNMKQVRQDKETIHYGIFVPIDAPITNWKRQFWNDKNEIITRDEVDKVPFFNLNDGNAHIAFLFQQDPISTILINYYNICVNKVPKKRTASLEGTYHELTEWGYPSDLPAI
jgi:hypothetical protein